jgi:hypothetical protein
MQSRDSAAVLSDGAEVQAGPAAALCVCIRPVSTTLYDLHAVTSMERPVDTRTVCSDRHAPTSRFLVLVADAPLLQRAHNEQVRSNQPWWSGAALLPQRLSSSRGSQYDSHQRTFHSDNIISSHQHQDATNTWIGRIAHRDHLWWHSSWQFHFPMSSHYMTASVRPQSARNSSAFRRASHRILQS